METIRRKQISHHYSTDRSFWIPHPLCSFTRNSVNSQAHPLPSQTLLSHFFNNNSCQKLQMFSNSLTVALFMALVCASAFTAPPTRTYHSSLQSSVASLSSRSPANTQLHAYIPDGLTAAEYQKIKEQEAKRSKGKNLGALGPRGFKSRSMQAWQEAYEKGFTGHSFAPLGYKEKLQKGELQKKDIPYMVRGGSWDSSDVPGAKRQRWLKTDKDYARGGYKKEQSASLLGSGPGLDWTGSRPRDVNLGNGHVPGFS
jgi:hypothetical protein